MSPLGTTKHFHTYLYISNISSKLAKHFARAPHDFSCISQSTTFEVFIRVYHRIFSTHLNAFIFIEDSLLWHHILCTYFDHGDQVLLTFFLFFKTTHEIAFPIEIYQPKDDTFFHGTKKQIFNKLLSYQSDMIMRQCLSKKKTIQKVDTQYPKLSI
ncbi:hypothetical protein AMTRI_Chr02g253780 [Amborella trichopoda]